MEAGLVNDIERVEILVSKPHFYDNDAITAPVHPRRKRQGQACFIMDPANGLIHLTDHSGISWCGNHVAELIGMPGACKACGTCFKLFELWRSTYHAEDPVNLRNQTDET